MFQIVKIYLSPLIGILFDSNVLVGFLLFCSWFKMEEWCSDVIPRLRWIYVYMAKLLKILQFTITSKHPGDISQNWTSGKRVLHEM